MDRDYDVWVGGYPRSANSFATAALSLSNPGLRIATHWHLPPFIISAVRNRRPGLLLIRRPKDAVLSWTIFWQGRLTIETAIEYYQDFHRALIQYQNELFVATFEETTTEFQQLTLRFNKAFGTNYACLPSNVGSLDRCVAYVENLFRARDGSLNEFTVPRPSAERTLVKAKLEAELLGSKALLEKLRAAEEVYELFKAHQRSQVAAAMPAPASHIHQLSPVNTSSVSIS